MVNEMLSPKRKMVVRHSKSVRIEHWLIALSTILLINSAIGEIKVIHYMAAAVLILASCFHVISHLIRKEFGLLLRKGDIKQSFKIIKAMLLGKAEPQHDKYLAEQRVAYTYIFICISVLILTGIVKLLKEFPSTKDLAKSLKVIGELHNVATAALIIGIVAHLLAFYIRENRPLLKGMLTGKVDLEYVKNRHHLWYKKLNIRD